jgi:hypothetical protein
MDKESCEKPCLYLAHQGNGLIKADRCLGVAEAESAKAEEVLQNHSRAPKDLGVPCLIGAVQDQGFCRRTISKLDIITVLSTIWWDHHFDALSIYVKTPMTIYTHLQDLAYYAPSPPSPSSQC